MSPPLWISHELRQPPAYGGLRLQIVNMSLKHRHSRASSVGGSAMVSLSPAIATNRSVMVHAAPYLTTKQVGIGAIAS